jgi:hypothetical protein
MAKRKLLTVSDMAKTEARVDAIGGELYRLIGDCPALDTPEWACYVAPLLRLHRRIYREAVRLKLAGAAKSAKLASTQVLINSQVGGVK